MQHDRRKSDAAMSELSKNVHDLNLSVKLQTQELRQQKELTKLHIQAIEKEHKTVKDVLFNHISDQQELQEETDDRLKALEAAVSFVKGMAKAAAIFWVLCTTLAGGIFWLLTGRG